MCVASLWGVAVVVAADPSRLLVVVAEVVADPSRRASASWLRESRRTVTLMSAAHNQLSRVLAGRRHEHLIAEY